MALYPGPTTFPGPDTFTGAGPVDVADPGEPPRPAWWPTTRDVARVAARFTTGPDGKAKGVYGEDTVPKESEVRELLSGVAQDVSNAVGSDRVQVWANDPHSTGAAAARAVIALGTASRVALSYYPNGNAGEIGDRLEARYTTALSRLLGGGGTAPDTGDGGSGASPATPSGGFPPAPDPERDRW